MSKGILLEQHLVTMQKVVEKILPPQSLFFSNLLSATNYPSDEIKWEVSYMTGGMSPIVAPGTQAPTIGGDGIGQKNAAAAFWKEKSYLDEVLLNNLRKVGTYQEKENAEAQLAKRLRKLIYRSQLRREWLSAKAIVAGAISYQNKMGIKFSVDYNVPAANKVTLSGNYVWGTGSTRAPMQDLFNAKQALADNFGINPNVCIMNTNTMKLLLWDANIQTLLQKSQFGEGDLFARPNVVLGTLLGVGPIVIYDAMYDVPSFITGTVTGSSTTAIPVEDASDFEVGGTLRFYNLTTENVWEDRTISSVSIANSTVTVSSAPTNSYVAGRDRVTMKKRFIADKSVILLSNSVDGEGIGEFMQCPFGLGGNYGMTVDSWDDKDPEGTWLRVQNKGLPVIYHPEAIYQLTVG